VRSLLVAVGICLSACKTPEQVERADPGLVRVATQRTIQTDTVGLGDRATPATYVLVDAQNMSDGDLDVTLVGTLHDASGARLGALRPESLRIPSGGTRTFVLVDERYRVQPEATTAEVEVRSALIPRWAPTLQISDAHVFDDLGAAQIAATVTNTADRHGRAIVFGAFHDADGAPVQRQFAVLDLGPGASETLRFTGPKGTRSAYMFLGDARY
jgi:hypothetical protein